MYPLGTWALKILMFALLVTREIATYNWSWEKTNAQVCVYLTVHITKITITNYISKTFLYVTFRMYPSRTWALKILMFALLVTREIATYSWSWEKTGDNKYTPMLFSVWPLFLLIVIANVTRTKNLRWRKTNSQSVPRVDMISSSTTR
jgi:hypothetical protein